MRIEVENLTIKYSEGLPFETTAINDVSLTIEPGEFCSIIGHTGSGKTTLVHAIAEQKKFKGVGLVFQYPEYQLFEDTVLSDVCFGPKNQGYSQEDCEKRAKIALKICGIDFEKKKDVSPFSLSGGEKRRVAIAGVLAMQPEVLILDEPTAGLDPKGHDDILDMIQKIRRDNNITIIMVSHNMDDVARLSDHVIVMDNGSKVLDGTPMQVFSSKELLTSIGLGIPSSMEFLDMLNQKVIEHNIDINKLCLEDAADEIYRQFEK